MKFEISHNLEMVSKGRVISNTGYTIGEWVYGVVNIFLGMSYGKFEYTIFISKSLISNSTEILLKNKQLSIAQYWIYGAAKQLFFKLATAQYWFWVETASESHFASYSFFTKI